MLPLDLRPMRGALMMSSETWLTMNYVCELNMYLCAACMYTWLCLCSFSFLQPSAPSHPTVRVDRAVHSTREDDVDVMNCIGSCQCRYGIMEWTSVSHSILIKFTRLSASWAAGMLQGRPKSRKQSKYNGRRALLTFAHWGEVSNTDRMRWWCEFR